jgi:peptidoglycan/LPS O-acetylase OafA/YrhL
MNLQQKMDASGGRPIGFDYLRIVLSVAVVAWHGVVVCYGHPAELPFWEGPLRPIIYSILLMFFTLSGFLVAGSLERVKTTSEFLTLRAVRLVPALAVEVFLSALIIGPLVTKIPLSEYFLSHRFFTYFLNIIGHIQFDLPGVFLDNPLPNKVNLVLWTVPYELECYLAIAVASLLGIAARRNILAILVLCLFAVFVYLEYEKMGDFSRFFLPNGRLMVFSFLVGILMFKYRHEIPSDVRIFCASVVAFYFLALNDWSSWVSIFPAAYMTVYIGILNPKKIPILMDGDYSYGVYVFAFPIQQLSVHLLPESLQEWWLITSIAIPLSLTYAAFSWHCVEKPVLQRRKIAVEFVGKLIGTPGKRGGLLGLLRLPSRRL